MKLGMGPLFDMLYPKKWSNSVRRTVRPAKPEICPAIFFHVFSRFGSFGVDLEKNFSTKIFDQKKLNRMMTSSIVKYSVERVFLVKTFWLKKKILNQLQMIQKVKKKRLPVKFGPPDGPTGRKTSDRFFSRFGSFGVIKTE